MRVLGLDVGDRRIGIAVSDPTGLIASPHGIIHRTAERSDHEAISALVLDLGIEMIVIGLPKTLQGDIGYQAQRVLRFGERLAERVAVPVAYWDERHSTVDAEEIARSSRRSRARRQSGAVDDIAAAVILQFYLDSNRS